MAELLRLRELREAADMTQVELADALGIPQANFSRLESGKSLRVDLRVLVRACEVLRCTMAEMVPIPKTRRR